jgi:hypothetical protein
MAHAEYVKTGTTMMRMLRSASQENAKPEKESLEMVNVLNAQPSSK